jgi:hypothetical protein
LNPSDDLTTFNNLIFYLTSELFPLTFPRWAFFICSWYCSTSKADSTYSFLTRKGLALFFASSSAIFKHLKIGEDAS